MVGGPDLLGALKEPGKGKGPLQEAAGGPTSASVSKEEVQGPLECVWAWPRTLQALTWFSAGRRGMEVALAWPSMGR